MSQYSPEVEHSATSNNNISSSSPHIPPTPSSRRGSVDPRSSAAHTSQHRERLPNITTAYPSNFSSTTNTPLHTPRRESVTAPSPSLSNRSSIGSFAEILNLRYPAPPRLTRNNSVSGSTLTELLMHPASKANGADERFKGRDWRRIELHEIIDPNETRFVELSTSIEDTTKLLIRSGAPNVVLVRESTKSRTVIQTFGYSDLNAYLLVVLGLVQPDEKAAKIAERARSGDVIPLADVTDHLGAREEPEFLPHTATLTQAMEVLGGGHHRVVVCKEGTSEAVGVLTQLRLVRFFWDNHRNFAATERLYSLSLKDLELGAKHVLAINGDKPVADALRLMHSEGITSLPVLDGQGHVVGNISQVDVRLLTDTSAIPLLSASCVHFISVILSERGLWDGKDSYPVFHVTHFSTLAHTVAKLCATRSHRMWIVDAPSPSTSVPPSPGMSHASPASSLANSGVFQHSTPATTPARHGSQSEPTPPNLIPASPSIAVLAGSLPGAGMSGRLTGVVSLTDVLNLFARASGLSPGDPEETRNRRRRQSSSSSVRPSFDGLGARPSAEALRQSTEINRSEIGRSSSVSSRDRGFGGSNAR